MPDREKIIKGLESQLDDLQKYADDDEVITLTQTQAKDILELLKEQENKRTTPHKKHIITWSRNEPFSAGELYEEICKTLRNEGELFIARTYKHEKVDYMFYVADRR